jgi:phosphoglycerate dehydrogenase-like enzyme
LDITMSKAAYITAEIDPRTIEELEAMGYDVKLGGWGQTRSPLSEEDLIGVMPGISLLVVEVEHVTARIMDASDSLEVIHVCRAAPSIVDVPAATERGIAVLSTPARNAESVAEFTLGSILALARNISKADRHLRQVGWHVGEDIPYFHFRGPEIARRTLGLVGCGAVGRTLLDRMRGFEMKVLIYDPYLEAAEEDELGTLTSLDEVLTLADFVIILCSLTPETRSMIGEAQLSKMKPTAYLINPARAAVVDEQALLDALKMGHIAGAALDVFWEEPLAKNSPWRSMEKVLLTPHLGGASDNVKRHQGKMLVEDLQCLARGEVPARLANSEILT